jgi:hypothetical protein
MVDKGKMKAFPQPDLLGSKPAGTIGLDIVGKLKKKKADSLIAKKDTFNDGTKANVAEVSKSIGNFVNRK